MKGPQYPAFQLLEYEIGLKVCGPRLDPSDPAPAPSQRPQPFTGEQEFVVA